MQNDRKDKDSEFESFVFWVLLHDSNDLKRPSVKQALGRSIVLRDVVRYSFHLIDSDLRSPCQSYEPCFHDEAITKRSSALGSLDSFSFETLFHCAEIKLCRTAN